MAKGTRSQGYPRIENELDKYFGYLDTDKLVEHSIGIGIDLLKKIIVEAINYANKKSSRKILDIDPEIEGEELIKIYKNKGQELFDYFIKYCGDPASTAYDSQGKNYRDVANENFRNRTLQKERMNSGWRYQHIAKDTARHSGRFESVSDLNSVEADFNVVVRYKRASGKLNIYVSIKNRSNTMGGQDWPKAIEALEKAAVMDKNREGPYLCVFGIAMERGNRKIKGNQKSGMPYSMNTEVWNSDFFWPFFSNFSYDEIAKTVLDVLIENNAGKSLVNIDLPDELLESFGDMCRKFSLVDESGNFNDAYKLVNLFCGKY